MTPRTCCPVCHSMHRAAECPVCRVEREEAARRATVKWERRKGGGDPRGDDHRAYGSVDYCLDCRKEYPVASHNQRRCTKCAHTRRLRQMVESRKRGASQKRSTSSPRSSGAELAPESPRGPRER